MRRSNRRGRMQAAGGARSSAALAASRPEAELTGHRSCSHTHACTPAHAVVAQHKGLLLFIQHGMDLGRPALKPDGGVGGCRRVQARGRRTAAPSCATPAACRPRRSPPAPPLPTHLLSGSSWKCGRRASSSSRSSRTSTNCTSSLPPAARTASASCSSCGDRCPTSAASLPQGSVEVGGRGGEGAFRVHEVAGAAARVRWATTHGAAAAHKHRSSGGAAAPLPRDLHEVHAEAGLAHGQAAGRGREGGLFKLWHRLASANPAQAAAVAPARALAVLLSQRGQRLPRRHALAQLRDQAALLRAHKDVGHLSHRGCTARRQAD